MTILSRADAQPDIDTPRPGRVIMAFLMAPSAGGIGIAFGLSIFTPTFELLQLAMTFPILYLITTPFVYFFSILLGPPYWLLLRFGMGVNRSRLVVGWAIIGMLSLTILAGFNLPDTLRESVFYIPFAIGGAMVGYVFWWVLATDKKCTKGEEIKTGNLDEAERNPGM